KDQIRAEQRREKPADLPRRRMKRERAPARAAEVARKDTGAYRMLRAGADAAEQPRRKEMLITRREAARDHRQAENAVADAENDAAANVRDDEAVGALEHVAERIIRGGDRSNRGEAQSEFLHHQRVDDAEHRRLEMVDEMRPADDAEDRAATERSLAGYG